jgi:hypothetical protein
MAQLFPKNLTPPRSSVNPDPNSPNSSFYHRNLTLLALSVAAWMIASVLSRLRQWALRIVQRSAATARR